MRILFVSSTTVGGSGRSQRSFADRLDRAGHDTGFLVDDGRADRLTRWAYEQSTDLATRWGARPGYRVIRWLEGRIGRGVRELTVDGRRHMVATVPQNALPGVLQSRRPDIIVVSSVERLAWTRIHDTARDMGVPVVLYVREDDSLEHLARGAVPDLLVANAESLVIELRSRGHECEFVPSVIDVDVTRVDSSRRAVLAINPIPNRGSDIVWRAARDLPEVPFVVQESWPLTSAELDAVHTAVAELPNVEFRRSAPPGPDLYADCRVLLVPYRVDNRPRVVAEAQANGIPVIAADLPALREAVGGGGVLVDGSDWGAWAAAIARAFEDQRWYDELSAASLAHAARDEIDPDAVARRFVGLLEPLVSDRRRH